MRLAVPIFVAFSVGAVACGGGHGRYGQPVHTAERATVAGSEVSEDAFAGAVRDLLASEPSSKERQLRLQGVIARQMMHVAERFKARDRDRALASLEGAMYLVHAGELTNEMLGSQAHEALHAASEELAKKGDEGRAKAVYEMLLRVSPASERADIQAHLDAINAWTKDTSGGGPMQIAGALEAAAVERHLLEPSIEARDDAVAKTLDFLEKAQAIRNARRTRGAQVDRAEGLEAVRALETGPEVLAAIYIRNADADGAVKALSASSVRETAEQQQQGVALLHALDAVVDHPDSDKWLDLARLLRPQQRQRADEEDFGRDQDLMRVAAFAAAAESYRLDATSPEPAAFVSAMLVDLGMGEAAPAILVDAVKAQKDPRMVGLALTVTMQAMERSLEAEDADGVRRTFKAAQPILAAADAYKGKVQPAPSKVYEMMGDIEMREGRLDDARTLLTDAAAREKNGATLLALARIDWHDGKSGDALARLKEALGADDAKDPGLRGEILLLESDIDRESGDASGAKQPLGDALRHLAKARGQAEGEGRARIERLIARVLDRFGSGSSAMKALDRALEAAPHDKREAAQTVGQMVGRAFVRGDLAAAREGLAHGMSAELGREDLVYYALWVRILEKQNPRAAADPNAEHILQQAADDPRWIGRIAAFGAGRMNAAGLVAAAQTPTQRTEALFYSAMDKRIAGDVKGEGDVLKEVVASPGIDLMEVALAREILDGPRATLGGPAPDVGLP